MNNRNIVGASIGLAVLVIAAAIAFAIVKAANTPTVLSKQAMDALKSWGEVNVTETAQNDVLEVKPIGELALARVRVRSIIKYRNSSWGSEKMIIAHQSFEAKFGWDLHDGVKIHVLPETKTVQIQASTPRLLTLTRIEVTPVTVYSSGGVFNSLNPADQDNVTKQLQDEVYKDPDLQQGLVVAKEEFEKYFSGIYLAQGFKVVFDYADQKLN